MNRHAFGRRTHTAAEPLERRVYLSAAADPMPAGTLVAAPPSSVEIQSESITAPIDVNGLVSQSRASVTGTQPDIGSFSNLFDGDNASLYRTPAVNPAFVVVTFTTPKTVREFTARFSHAGGNPAYRWKVEAAGGSLGAAFIEVVPWTNTASDVDSAARLAAPVTATRFRLTAQRLTGDNYVHANEWKLVGETVISSLALVPSNTSHSLRQYQQLRLRAEGVAADGSRVDLTDQVTWTSTNERVATVDPTGLVRGVAVGGAGIRASLGTLQINTTVSVGNPFQRDLDATYVERTPRYNYDAAKKNPAPGDLVTFRGHVRNWDDATAEADYRWELDGVPVASGTLEGLGAHEERVVTFQWNWQNGPHRIKLVVDPENKVAEASEANNSVEDRTDGISVGFWVEQSLYDYFHARQRDLGIGSNSWEDWAQRQMGKWNEHNANAVWAGVTPGGVTDRVRIDKIVVVPDGALPLNGGLPSNNPDTRDKTVDMMWGFEWNPDSTFYSNTTSKDPNNPFYLEPSLVHELGHARYLIDNYTFDVHNTASYRSVQLVEPTTGQPVAGTALMPFLAFGEVLYYNQGGGIMTGPYWNTWSPHEAGALQRIAGRRAVSGNQNAPGNIGEYLNDLPANNHVRFVDGAGRPLVGAEVRWYSAGPGPGYGGKTFDNTPERTLTTDADGYIHLPRDPFLAGQMKEAVLRVAHEGNVWYRFFEVAEMNLEYWRGNRQDGYYSIDLPLRTAPPEIEISGFGTVPIADADSSPSHADSTDFGEADVSATGPGLGAGDARGYAIRTFVVRNKGGQPLRLTGTPRVAVFGAHASDFSVVTLPADTVAAGTLTVFQVKFDPRAVGLRTANITVSSNDGDEGRYDIAIRGIGTAPGAEVWGVKFNDVDADGTRDEGEAGLADWLVYGDLDEDGVLDAGEPAATTGADGSYTLGGLPDNRLTYVLEVQQAGWRQSFPSVNQHRFNPFIDAVQTPMDFGNTRRALVRGTVFDDRNANGVFEPGDRGLAGRVVYADLDGEDSFDPGEPFAVTDGAGNYALVLDPGAAAVDYVLKQVPVAGWADTTPASHEVRVAQGQTAPFVNFGQTRQVHNAVLFYNNSAFDGNDPAANSADDGAVEVFKSPLFGGGTGTFLNVSGYFQGINGLMIHVGALPPAGGGGSPALSADDFDLRVGSGDDVSSWAPAPPPAQVAVRRAAGASGTDLVTLVWPDGSIRNTWLQVTLKANERTGIAAPEVFYFGSLVGETGDGGSPLRVTALDLSAVKQALNRPAPITSPLDFNRDGLINALDVAALKASLSRALVPLRPPAPPSVTFAAAAAMSLAADDDDVLA